ncbi:hypothetical protein [Ligilactobacillus salivarius]|uniref:hypothetical protein n=1 Tax=Ligilactobacillus salivarius TaxID=1624 RepID=UPI002097C78F|nr:hypothetical protein [Ligilactobacillus salivarius]MCO7134670.1 hypothetical protein [Ligilactobacillus salivarius]
MNNENQDVEVEKTNEEVENQDNAGKVEEEELANAKAELEAYKLGKKTVKKLSEEDKAKKEKRC